KGDRGLALAKSDFRASGLDAALEKILRRALADAPEARFSSARAFQSQLEAYVLSCGEFGSKAHLASVAAHLVPPMTFMGRIASTNGSLGPEAAGTLPFGASSGALAEETSEEAESSAAESSDTSGSSASALSDDGAVATVDSSAMASPSASPSATISSSATVSSSATLSSSALAVASADNAPTMGASIVGASAASSLADAPTSRSPEIVMGRPLSSDTLASDVAMGVVNPMPDLVGVSELSELSDVEMPDDLEMPDDVEIPDDVAAFAGNTDAPQVDATSFETSAPTKMTGTRRPWLLRMAMAASLLLLGVTAAVLFGSVEAGVVVVPAKVRAALSSSMLSDPVASEQAPPASEAAPSKTANDPADDPVDDRPAPKAPPPHRKASDEDRKARQADALQMATVPVSTQEPQTTLSRRPASHAESRPKTKATSAARSKARAPTPRTKALAKTAPARPKTSEQRRRSVRPAKRPRAPARSVEDAASARTAAPKRTASTDGAKAKPASKARGFLAVDTIPWTKIWIDGRPYGSTPRAGLALSTGRHQLRLVNEAESVDHTTMIEVQAGKTVRIRRVFGERQP
ncbi:MAG: PEGA domain-containing protein, partial [Myxococcota bacterium]